MLSEEEFIKRALEFLTEIGADTTGVDADTQLFENDVLDSLSTLAFLDFLEQLRGEDIDIETLDIDQISSLRNAYGFTLPEKQNV